MSIGAPQSAIPFLPYGRQNIIDADIDAVTDVLRSDWLTQGPAIAEFEGRLSGELHASHATVCSNGTAALHLAMLSLGLGPGDTVLTSPITFLASANCARYVGADVCFADVDAATALLDPDAVAEVLARDREKRIKAIVPVHFAGQPVPLDKLKALADAHGAFLVDDACHAIGASYRVGDQWIPVGSGSDSHMTAFSFHPVKHITTGEGGALTTSRADLAERAAMFRTHGIRRSGFRNADMAVASDGAPNPWYHEQQELGFNYRLTDIQAALGMSQLTRLGASVRKRNQLATWYAGRLAHAFPDGSVRPLHVRDGVVHAYHLFVVQIDFEHFRISRADVMNGLKARNIGTQVHYIPVHLQPYYRDHSGTGPGDFPKAERYYQQALSLPMYPELVEADVERVVAALEEVLRGHR